MSRLINQLSPNPRLQRTRSAPLAAEPQAVRRQPVMKVRKSREKLEPPGGGAGLRLENIEFLLKGHGDITLGRIGPIRCAATAASDGNTLAMLVRRPRESFVDLLARLDSAIGDAMEQDITVDEING